MKRLVRMRFWGCGVWLCLSAMAQGAAAASPPSESTGTSEITAQSRVLMKEGASKFEKGDWEGALLSYQKAWELKQHPAIASNMAAAEIKLGRYLDAAEHLKFALLHLPLASSNKRDAVQEQLDECQAHLLVLKVSVNIDDAEVLIDGRSIGKSPYWEDVLLRPGPHVVNVWRSGYVAESRQISGSSGLHVEVSFVLHPTPPRESSSVAVRSVVSGTSEGRPRWYNDTRTWVLIGGTAATAISLGVGIAYRIKSNSDWNEHATIRSELDRISSATDVASGSECSGQSPPALCGPLHESGVTFDRDRNLSTGAFITAGVLGLGAAATVLLWPTRGSGERQTGLHRWQLVPSFGLRRTEIALKIVY